MSLPFSTTSCGARVTCSAAARCSTTSGTTGTTGRRTWWTSTCAISASDSTRSVPRTRSRPSAVSDIGSGPRRASHPVLAAEPPRRGDRAGGPGVRGPVRRRRDVARPARRGPVDRCCARDQGRPGPRPGATRRLAGRGCRKSEDGPCPGARTGRVDPCQQPGTPGRTRAGRRGLRRGLATGPPDPGREPDPRSRPGGAGGPVR